MDGLDFGNDKDISVTFSTDVWLSKIFDAEGYVAMKGYRVLLLDDAHCMSDETEKIVSHKRQLLDFRKGAKEPFHIILMSATLNNERLTDFFQHPDFHYDFVDLTPHIEDMKCIINKIYLTQSDKIEKVRKEPEHFVVGQIDEMFASATKSNLQYNTGVFALAQSSTFV